MSLAGEWISITLFIHLHCMTNLNTLSRAVFYTLFYGVIPQPILVIQTFSLSRHKWKTFYAWYHNIGKFCLSFQG
jgi:hypothetical protein